MISRLVRSRDPRTQNAVHEHDCAVYTWASRADEYACIMGLVYVGVVPSLD
jgi:hypothetical protein